MVIIGISIQGLELITNAKLGLNNIRVEIVKKAGRYVKTNRREATITNFTLKGTHLFVCLI